MAVINNVTFQHADLEFSFAVLGEPLAISDAVSEMSYSDSVEREKLRGASRVSEDSTEGEYDAEGAVTFFQKYYRYITAWLAERNVGFYDVEFTLTVNYRNKGEPLHTDTITKCKFASREKSSSAGSEGLTVPCDLFIGGRIYADGIGPFGERLGGQA